jgi:hypothetical protein
MPIGGNPYKQTIRDTGFSTPNFSLPAIGATQGPGNGSLEAYQYSPEELEAMISQGWKVFEDGSMAPPLTQEMPGAFTSPMPSAGRMDAPDPFASSVFNAYNAVANPAPVEKDPLKQMMRNPFKEPKPGLSLSVPGGASIQNGQPLAAPTPTPPEREDPTAPKKNPYGGRVGRRMAARQTTRR